MRRRGSFDRDGIDVMLRFDEVVDPRGRVGEWKGRERTVHERAASASHQAHAEVQRQGVRVRRGR